MSLPEYSPSKGSAYLPCFPHEVDSLRVFGAPKSRTCTLFVIPFRLNNSAYNVLIISFTFSVGGDQLTEQAGR
jgi:hypothetical protein